MLIFYIFYCSESISQLFKRRLKILLNLAKKTIHRQMYPPNSFTMFLLMCVCVFFLSKAVNFGTNTNNNNKLMRNRQIYSGTRTISECFGAMGCFHLN